MFISKAFSPLFIVAFYSCLCAFSSEYVFTENDWGTNGDITTLLSTKLLDDSVTRITIPLISGKETWLTGPQHITAKNSSKVIEVFSIKFNVISFSPGFSISTPTISFFAY